jgi:NAD(P)-dependent dehydrogenase (short-subunit alcohol dehydrogenase family)
MAGNDTGETRTPRPVALVTGAGGAIGRGTAVELAASGFDVCLTDLDRSELAPAQAQAALDTAAGPGVGHPVAGETGGVDGPAEQVGAEPLGAPGIRAKHLEPVHRLARARPCPGPLASIGLTPAFPAAWARDSPLA